MDSSAYDCLIAEKETFIPEKLSPLIQSMFVAATTNLDTLYNDDCSHYSSEFVKTAEECLELSTKNMITLFNYSAISSEKQIVLFDKIKEHVDEQIIELLRKFNEGKISSLSTLFQDLSSLLNRGYSYRRELLNFTINLRSYQSRDSLSYAVIEALPDIKEDATLVEKSFMMAFIVDPLVSLLEKLIMPYALSLFILEHPIIIEIKEEKRKQAFNSYVNQITSGFDNYQKRVEILRGPESVMQYQEGMSAWIAGRLTNSFLDKLVDLEIGKNKLTPRFKGKRTLISDMEEVPTEEVVRASNKIKNSLKIDETVKVYKITAGVYLPDSRPFASYFGSLRNAKDSSLPQPLAGNYLVVVQNGNGITSALSTTIGRAISAAHRQITTSVMDSFELSF